jgi:hypothetical protein
MSLSLKRLLESQSSTTGISLYWKFLLVLLWAEEEWSIKGTVSWASTFLVRNHSLLDTGFCQSREESFQEVRWRELHAC